MDCMTNWNCDPELVKFDYIQFQSILAVDHCNLQYDIIEAYKSFPTMSMFSSGNQKLKSSYGIRLQNPFVTIYI